MMSTTTKVQYQMLGPLWNDKSFSIEIEVSHELFCVLLMDLVGKSAGYRMLIIIVVYTDLGLAGIDV